MPLAARLTLAIETSNPSSNQAGLEAGPGVALGLCAPGRPPQVIGTERLRTVGRHDDDLMPAIDRLCTAANIRPRSILRVAVSVGPGGFTALRIAVATAKMIAEAAGAPCVSVPTALVVAARADVQTRAHPFAVALSSKGDTAFATVFPASNERDPSGLLITATDLDRLNIRTLIADSFLPEPLRVRAGALGIRIVEPIFDPAACLEVSSDLPDLDPVELLPLYPREPEAVTLWRQRGKSAQSDTT
jgi:tRNA threonylcarbamoyl adenosine modification protein YeaZ